LETSLTPAERSLRGTLANHQSWANTENRAERTAPARRALDQKFLDQAGGDPQRAESLRKAYYARLAFESAKARRKNKTVGGVTLPTAGTTRPPLNPGRFKG
jgi:hypothetical protein